jgi:1-acyl-sn-glycerol-3-phosphate acyltransferase
MIYNFGRFLMRITLWVYYKRIIIDGLQHLPKTGPVILASNHPNSFLDACILGTHLPRRLHFIARSDVFNSPMKQWILGKLQLIPIYRLQEGIENLDKNKDTFKKCHEVLNAGGVINIYSEGICIQEKRLRKLKKGTARIALDYVDEFKKSLPVVAVGLNYMEPMKFRKEIIIGISKPFDAAEVKPGFSENPAQAIIAFNQKLTEKLKEEVIHIESKEREKEIDFLLLAKRNQLGFQTGFLIKDSGLLKKLIEFVNQLNPNELPPIEKKYEKKTSALLKIFLQLMALPGIILNGVPLLAAKKLTQSKVKLKEFKDSVLVASGMIFSLIHFIIIVTFISIFFGSWSLAFVGLMALTGWISRACYDAWASD